VSTKSVCADGYGEFSGNGAGDFSALPAFRIMQ
jgi:hypothetical protein